MAFFKFRFPGQSESAEAVNVGTNENVEVVRRRARHRLMGAVVLVLFAVVGFPLIFDTQPRPVSVDTPIVIPDRQNASPLSSSAPVPAEQAPAKPLLSSAEAVSPQASLDTREEVVSSAPAVTEVKPDSSKAANSADKVINKDASVKTETTVKEETKSASPAKTEKPVLASKPKDSGEKAQALLDGKTEKAPTGRIVIQVGAFSDAAKVRDVRSKLEQAGLKTYTQVVDGKEGKNTTRVRVGPFETRAEADKAAVRIRKLDLPAALLTL